MPTKVNTTETGAKNSSRIPKTRKISLAFLGKINITYILFTLLIIAAFLLGVLVTKVQYLEKGASLNQPSINNNITGDANPQPQQPTGPVDVTVGDLPPLGEKGAKVALVLFSDFECPFCKSFYDEALPKIKEEYIDTGKAVLYFRHFPLTSIHPKAQLAHEASGCADDQGNFWGYHDTLFDEQNTWISLADDAFQGKLVEYAGNLGLNTGDFEACLTSGKYTDKVNKDLEEGTQVGVDGTPATFVNGYMVIGAVPYEEFKSQIEARLAE